MKNFFLLTSLFLFATSAQADLGSLMQRLSRFEKGPFGLNVLQGTSERIPIVASGSQPVPRNLQFQAAFRNETARTAAQEEGIYLGNLFTTNYYELMGEYVYRDAYGSHPLDHSALAKQGSAAIGKAALMVQHWVLEKHYLHQFPDSAHSRAFKYRGIGGSEFEQPYANHFLNFFLGAMDGDFQYLSAYLLAVRSPIIESSALSRARDQIAKAYNRVSSQYGQNDRRAVEMFRLRNSIHNQMSAAVVGEIDRYLNAFSGVEANTLQQIKGLLQDYFSFNAEKLARQADHAGLRDLKAAADQITAQGANAQTLLQLSQVAANWRTNIRNASILPADKRATALALLADTARLLSKELTLLEQPRSPEVGIAVLNTIYVEGFLIKDNLDYFKSEMANEDMAKVIGDVIDVASVSLQEAFSTAYPQWLAMEPKMQYFLDNTIKSSAVSTASTLAEKMRR